MNVFTFVEYSIHDLTTLKLFILSVWWQFYSDLMGVPRCGIIHFVGNKAALSNALSDEKPTANFHCYQGIQPSLLQFQDTNICREGFCIHHVLLIHVFVSWRDLVHRPLHNYMDRNEALEVYHRGPTFLGLFVTKPVVTPGTNRCQMKDLNKIFP